MTLDIRHDRDARRFEAFIEGLRCELDYTLTETVMTITHTGVPESLRGRGIAAELVQAAFSAARDAGWKVRPACSYAAAWVRRHPQWNTSLA